MYISHVKKGTFVYPGLYPRQKDHQRVITWDFTPPEHCKPQGYPIPIP
jgi:hypothetical protein